MSKHILFMLNPWFEKNNQGPFYCPDCGVVEGFFAYSPEVRKQIEIIWLDYEKPRHKVIECLGAQNQGCPVLVLDDNAKPPLGVKKSLLTGKTFIDDPKMICDYLGQVFNGVRPHP